MIQDESDVIEGYREMANDKEREEEALAWAEGFITELPSEDDPADRRAIVGH